MSISTVKTVVIRFLTDEKPGVLAIKGAWGVGKTFAWDQITQNIRDQIKPPHYCYVSLFGITSLADLRLAIFAKTLPAKLIGKPLDTDTVNKEWALLSLKGLKSLGSVLSKLKDAPVLKHLSIGLDALAPHLIRNTVICLDDFERLSPNVQADEILGFISTLKEEKKCKVILIFNEQELTNKETTYKRYREKVIDIELLFSPSAEESIELTFPMDLPYRELAKRHALSLDVRNIRLLGKIVKFIYLIWPIIKNMHNLVMEQAIQTIVVVSWAYYDSSDDKPSLEFIRRWNRYRWEFISKKDNDIDDLTKKWIEQLEAYGLSHMDEFDYALAKTIEQGYAEDTGLPEAAKELDAKFHASDLENSFSAAWDLFHNSFNDNENELIDSLTISFEKSAKYISPINLNGTIKLLRELDRNELANKLLDYYMNARKDDKEIFDLDKYAFGSDITDQEIRERFHKRHIELSPLPSLLEAVSIISEERGWSNPEIEALNRASDDDFYSLLKSIESNNLNRMVRACLRFENIPGHEEIGQKVRKAIERIGSENRINKVRVKRFGVEI